MSLGTRFSGDLDDGSGTSGFTAAPVNDLWKFSPTTNMWTWVSEVTGRSVPAVYGTLGVAAPTHARLPFTGELD